MHSPSALTVYMCQVFVTEFTGNKLRKEPYLKIEGLMQRASVLYNIFFDRMLSFMELPIRDSYVYFRHIRRCSVQNGGIKSPMTTPIAEKHL